LALLAVLTAVGAGDARAAGRFHKADTDGNGVLSRAEAERGAPGLARHFDAIDADKDGNITPFEIRSWRKTRGSARRIAGAAQARSRFDEFFRKADADADGALSREEAAKGMRRVAGKFERIDTDRDGRLTLEEMHAWLDAMRAARKRRALSPS
jgi:Ca2+-binding EF-hand superfamily protein